MKNSGDNGISRREFFEKLGLSIGATSVAVISPACLETALVGEDPILGGDVAKVNLLLNFHKIEELPPNEESIRRVKRYVKMLLKDEELYKKLVSEEKDKKGFCGYGVERVNEVIDNFLHKLDSRILMGFDAIFSPGQGVENAHTGKELTRNDVKVGFNSYGGPSPSNPKPIYQIKGDYELKGFADIFCVKQKLVLISQSRDDYVGRIIGNYAPRLIMSDKDEEAFFATAAINLGYAEQVEPNDPRKSVEVKRVKKGEPFEIENIRIADTDEYFHPERPYITPVAMLDKSKGQLTYGNGALRSVYFVMDLKPFFEMNKTKATK